MTTNKHPTYMLWFVTNLEQTPSEMLAKAIASFQGKYRQSPVTICVPLGFPDLNGQVPKGIRIERSGYVLPRHFWLRLPENSIQPADDDTTEAQSQPDEIQERQPHAH